MGSMLWDQGLLPFRKEGCSGTNCECCRIYCPINFDIKFLRFYSGGTETTYQPEYHLGYMQIKNRKFNEETLYTLGGVPFFVPGFWMLLDGSGISRKHQNLGDNVRQWLKIPGPKEWIMHKLIDFLDYVFEKIVDKFITIDLK